MNLKTIFKSKKIITAMVALALMSGTAMAQSQPQLPPDNQSCQKTISITKDFGQPGQQPKILKTQHEQQRNLQPCQQVKPLEAQQTKHDVRPLTPQQVKPLELQKVKQVKPLKIQEVKQEKPRQVKPEKQMQEQQTRPVIQ